MPPLDTTLINEHPKIDAALKSYLSWLQVQDEAMPMTSVLAHARSLSLAINQHEPKDDDGTVVAEVWNEIQRRQQKPTKWLGRTALRHVWKDLDVSTVPESFRDPFAAFLFDERPDSDAKLIWGQGELQKRAAERLEKAQERLREGTSAWIEEVDDDEEVDVSAVEEVSKR